MATLTQSEQYYIDQFGPTPAYMPASGWTNNGYDKLVKKRIAASVGFNAASNSR